MRPKHAIWMLCGQACLLLLASTKFSVVNWLWGNWAWSWEYFQYSYRDGWGYVYRSDYSVAVVLAYLAAFVTGIIGSLMALRWTVGAWSALAMILSGLGLVSFLIEGSHWLWDHHLCWIAICPAASLLLAGIVIYQLARAGNPL